MPNHYAISAPLDPGVSQGKRGLPEGLVADPMIEQIDEAYEVLLASAGIKDTASATRWSAPWAPDCRVTPPLKASGSTNPF